MRLGVAQRDLSGFVAGRGGSILHGVIGWRRPDGRERRAVLAKAFPRLHPYSEQPASRL